MLTSSAKLTPELTATIQDLDVQGLVLQAIARQCGLDPLASLREKTREGAHAQDLVSDQAGRRGDDNHVALLHD